MNPGNVSINVSENGVSSQKLVDFIANAYTDFLRTKGATMQVEVIQGKLKVLMSAVLTIDCQTKGGFPVMGRNHYACSLRILVDNFSLLSPRG